MSDKHMELMNEIWVPEIKINNNAPWVIKMEKRKAMFRKKDGIRRSKIHIIETPNGNTRENRSMVIFIRDNGC